MVYSVKDEFGFMCWSTNWGSLEANHRAEIRYDLVNWLQRHGEISQVEVSSLLNLQDRPRLPRYAISISHCPSAGGWAIQERATHLGLDIEVRSRVSSAIVGRLSTASELAEAPEPALLWVAKEAGFKAFQSHQPVRLTSQLQIMDWQKLAIERFEFRVRGPEGHDVLGEAFALNSELVAARVGEKRSP